MLSYLVPTKPPRKDNYKHLTYITVDSVERGRVVI
jgi:hypothetical protein